MCDSCIKDWIFRDCKEGGETRERPFCFWVFCFVLLFCAFITHSHVLRFLSCCHVNPLGCNKRTVKNQQNKSWHRKRDFGFHDYMKTRRDIFHLSFFVSIYHIYSFQFPPFRFYKIQSLSFFQILFEQKIIFLRKNKYFVFYKNLILIICSK